MVYESPKTHMFWPFELKLSDFVHQKKNISKIQRGNFLLDRLDKWMIFICRDVLSFIMAVRRRPEKLTWPITIGGL